MKIKSVYIPDFLILKDFRIEFKKENNLAVIIGDNGSGKSTLLEVIAYIFGHLHKYFVLGDKTAEFINNYEIEFYSTFQNREYEVYLKSVFVDQKTNTFKPIIKIDNKELSITEIEKQFGGFKNFLPSRIGIYYAGDAVFLQELSEHFENKFINDIIRDKNPYSLDPFNLPSERPFYYVKYEYLGLILASLLINSSKDEKISKFLIEIIGEFEINNAEVKIVLKKPEWANKRNDKLWGINSTLVEQFVNKLNDKANYVDNKNSENEITYTFYGLIDLMPLFFEFSNDRDFSFILLDTLLFNGILSHMSIDFKLRNGNKINSDRLSEGQRQFIVTCGLGILWYDKPNKLFLYDEPDVFLHPKWQQKYIPFIQEYLGESFALLTTHNPALVSDVKKENLFVFEKGQTKEIPFSSYGKNVESLLIDFFNVEGVRNKYVENLLREVQELVKKKEFTSDVFKLKFNELKEILRPTAPEIVNINLEIAKSRK